MSTHNIGFYEDLTKKFFELSSNFIKYAPYFFCWKAALGIVGVVSFAKAYERWPPILSFYCQKPPPVMLSQLHFTAGLTARVLQSWPEWNSNLQTSALKPSTLTIPPQSFSESYNGILYEKTCLWQIGVSNSSNTNQAVKPRW